MVVVIDHIAGVYLCDDLGVCISPRSPLWDESDEEVVAILREARELMPHVEDIGIFGRMTHKTRETTIGYIFRGMDIEPRLLSTVLNAPGNPYFSTLDKSICREALLRHQNREQEILRNRAPSSSLRQKIIDRDNCICQYCGKELEVSKIQIDHIVPYSLGGLTELDNLVVACLGCNRKKGSKTLEESGMELLGR